MQVCSFLATKEVSAGLSSAYLTYSIDFDVSFSCFAHVSSIFSPFLAKEHSAVELVFLAQSYSDINFAWKKKTGTPTVHNRLMWVSPS